MIALAPVLAVLWGGLVGLDATSAPQAMYSRPLVAGTVVGLIFGRPAEGALLGLLLEFFALAVLPFGASAYPEGGPAAVAAGAAYFTIAGVRDDALLVAAVVCGVLISHVAGYSVRLLRVWNGRVARRIHGERSGSNPRRLEHAHWLAIGTDFVRAVALTAAAASLTLLVLSGVEDIGWALPFPPLLALATGGAAMVGATAHVFGRPRRHMVSLLLGGLAGAAVLLVT